MALTQAQISTQMVAQLRILDPSISAEVGTPERKIIDTVAEQIAETQVDVNQVSGALDLDSKFGSDLDNFVAMFGFGRQGGSYSTGFVTFSRPTGSAYNITISNGTQVLGSSTTTVTFQTTAAVTLVAGQTDVIAPIQAVVSGSVGNLAANTITSFANLGAPVLGITSLTNPLPTANGADSESDAELKVRFRNTVFRNQAGTEDQYMALAVATQFSTKANVIGPISRFQEYMQIPLVDDATTETSGNVIVDEPDGTIAVFPIPPDGTGNGTAGEWTTTPSDNPYAQYIYLNVPNFVSNGGSGVGTLFYRQDSDFTLNAPPLNLGDTYRAFHAAEPEIADPATTPNNPNITFFNVYTGTDITVTLPRPGDVVLLEYSYLSAESRNSIVRNITNCVDVYVNGQNPITADAVIPPPPGGLNLFSSNPTNKFYNENFRRIGQPDVTPVVGNIFTGLYWQPVIALPGQIVVDVNTYTLNIHYFAVQDQTLLGGTVRARNGIEWDATMNGATTSDPVVTPWTSGLGWQPDDLAYYNGAFYTAVNLLVDDITAPSADTTNWTSIANPFTGAAITTTGVTSLTVAGYTYDQNIIDLQTALDGAKQVTTDVLAHAATPRYFKLDLTLVYAAGSSPSSVNLAIETAVANFFSGQYFGTTIQLSDLLFTVRNVTGVQNVRWSNDVPNPADGNASTLERVTETDVNGNPRNPSVVYDIDFYLRDSELPSLPVGQLATDTLPGLILRPRAQNTFNII